MKLYAGERRSEGPHKVVVWDDVSFGMKYARYTRLEQWPVSTLSDPAAAFDWGGAAGAGMVNLATAILADCLGNQAAERHAAAFAASVLRRLPMDRWKLDESAVRAAVRGGEARADDTGESTKIDEPQLVTLAAWLASSQRPPPRRPHARAS